MRPSVAKIVKDLDLCRKCRDEGIDETITNALLGTHKTQVYVNTCEYQGKTIAVLAYIDGIVPDYPLVTEILHSHEGCDLFDEELAPRLAENNFSTYKHGFGHATTEQVVAFFRRRSPGADDVMPASFAPAACATFARIAIGGDIPDPADHTDDRNWSSNSYAWYDLNCVPIHGSIWRISCNDTLWLFTRENQTLWTVRISPHVRPAYTTQGYKEKYSVNALIQGLLYAKETRYEISR